MQLSVEEFAELLVSGSHSAAMERIVRYRVNGMNNLFLCEQLIMPAMRYIGDLWENNLVSVADEHLASGVCDWLLDKLEPMLPSVSSQPNRAMLFCVEGEMHDLGLKMCASLFREYNWDVRFYGSNMPLEYAMTSSMSWKPDVIAISFTMEDQIMQVKSYVEALEQQLHGPTIMVGSRLLDTYDLRPYVSPNTELIPNLVDLSSWLARYTTLSSELQELG
ncbi:methanogenic corrinoid protein MtbC1 [Paenibacillus phyllosphaerae]|uniref:Methanogenic corrinoid protein MtbC1 n=1 Tax=Paenibacillus phyllosphaerae TaxID=274593 RepID=A0A7W5FKY2_9BACL|nr:cobalamin-dependent protein [Paenibacillus phyllosphaerae]MBB3108596.1 methanogenic corrinoid protein MtbC1 [Paenibacillus phyllosphaerae]